MQQLAAQIPWMHNTVLIEKVKDKNIRSWYMEECIKNNWTRNVLIFQIENSLKNFNKPVGVSSYQFVSDFKKSLYEQLLLEDYTVSSLEEEVITSDL